MTGDRITWGTDERTGLPIGRLGPFAAVWYGFRGVEILHGATPEGCNVRALGYVDAAGAELDAVEPHVERRADVVKVMREKLLAFAAGRPAK
jgi:hypothetical protein